MPPLSVMIKPASGNCNMHCDYCFYCDEMARRSCASYGYMSEETLKNVIRKTMLQAEYQITYAFQGGEPTLRGLDFFRHAVALQQQYNHNHLRVFNALQTNGLQLNEEWCQFFFENHFLVGVSVDGPRDIHDRYRHRAGDLAPTYDRIRENIRMLERFHVDYNILTVVTEYAAGHPQEIYEHFMKNGWKYHQYIECLNPMDGRSTPYSLKSLSYGKFLTKIFDLWDRDLQAGRNPYNRRFENYLAILLGEQPESCEQRGTCGIQIVVEADGSAYPCDFYMLDEYCLGNFNRDRLPSMDQRRAEIGFISRSKKLSEECLSCPYLFICRGGCQRSRDMVSGQEAYISRFCQGYKYFFSQRLDRLKEIAESIRKQDR